MFPDKASEDAVRAQILVSEVSTISRRINAVAEESSAISKELAGEGLSEEERESLGRKLRVLIQEGSDLSDKRNRARAHLVEQEGVEVMGQEVEEE